jgi:hypothetical protein
MISGYIHATDMSIEYTDVKDDGLAPHTRVRIESQTTDTADSTSRDHTSVVFMMPLGWRMSDARSA